MTKITSRKIQQIIKLHNKTEAKFSAREHKSTFEKVNLPNSRIIAYIYGAVAHMQVWRPPIFI